MKILFIDMDGVIVDFMQSVKNHPEFEKYINEIDALPAKLFDKLDRDKHK